VKVLCPWLSDSTPPTSESLVHVCDIRAATYLDKKPGSRLRFHRFALQVVEQPVGFCWRLVPVIYLWATLSRSFDITLVAPPLSRPLPSFLFCSGLVAVAVSVVAAVATKAVLPLAVYRATAANMSASLPGSRALPESQYDLNTYWGRVRHTAGITDPRTLFVGRAGLEQAKNLLIAYKQGQIPSMTPELWRAKKIVDSTLHPDTGEPVFLPFRMSCFVLSNLVVTAGMLTPNLGVCRTFTSYIPLDPYH
jgi:hypothetical protein